MTKKWYKRKERKIFLQLCVSTQDPFLLFCYFVGYLFVALVGFAIVYKEGDLDMFLGGKTPTMEAVKLYCWGNIFTLLQCGASTRKNASAEKAFKQSLGGGGAFLTSLLIPDLCLLRTI